MRRSLVLQHLSVLWDEEADDVPERYEVEAHAGSELLFLPIAQAELHVRIRLRHLKRAEDEVPHRKHEREVLVDVCRMVAVMHLMMRGGSEHIDERSRPAQPDVRMSQVVAQPVVRDHEYPHPEQRGL